MIQVTEKEFLEKMQDEILDSESPVDMNQKLVEIREWDSLAIVNFIAAAKTSGKKIPREKVQSALTVAELYALLK